MEPIKEPLMNAHTPPMKAYLTADMSPMMRYNVVVDCYNMPCNIQMPQSNLYTLLYQISILFRGKILFVMLSLIPFLNIIIILLSGFYIMTFEIGLGIHHPFKRMTFDPELCYTMGCDYYFFNIELKQLAGFSLNYQQNVSSRLNLRKERGTTSLMVYNANFWASYSYIEKWKVSHFAPLIISIFLATFVDGLCIFLLLQ